MNIFATHDCPIESARWLDDKRLIKMILESAQLLCNALNHYNYLEVYDATTVKKRIENGAHVGYDKGKATKVYYFPDTWVRAYAPTHQNHPCSRWVEMGSGNYLWLYEHFVALCFEYTARYRKVHKSAGLAGYLFCGLVSIPNRKRTPFQNSAAHSGLGLDFKFIDPAFTPLAYKLYLLCRFERDKRPAVCTIPKRKRRLRSV